MNQTSLLKQPSITDCPKPWTYGRDIGKQSGARYVLVKCQQCHKERWLRYDSVHSLCHACSRPLSKNRKEANPHWTGGMKRVGPQGYIIIQIPDNDPYHCMTDKRGYVRLSRYVMAVELGRPLLESEVVHHRNGDVLDNAMDNLVLMDGREHTRRHVKAMVRVNGAFSYMRKGIDICTL